MRDPGQPDGERAELDRPGPGQRDSPALGMGHEQQLGQVRRGDDRERRRGSHVPQVLQLADIDVVIRVRVRDNHRAHVLRGGVPLQRAGRPVADIEQEHEAVLLDQVARAG